MKLWKTLFRKKHVINTSGKPEERWILSVDGGGMRGIIPLEVLKKLEDEIRKSGGDRSLTSYFDLIAGTSTGGLIALALSCPSSIETKPMADTNQVSLDAVEDIYLNRGDEIFTQGPMEKLFVTQLLTNKYNKEGIENLLNELFGEEILGNAICPVMVSAYDLSNGDHYALSSFGTPEVPVRIAARCTSAAPTYFSPVSLNDKLLADGGVIANNPAIYAYAAAKELYPDCELFHIVSISTGSTQQSMEESQISGVLNAAFNALKLKDMFLSAQKNTCDFIMNALSDVDYIRIDRQLDTEIKMDNTDSQVLKHLKEEGISTAKMHASAIENIAGKLVSRFSEA